MSETGFLYYNSETAELIALLEARSEELDALYACLEAPMAELLGTAFAASPEAQKGYVYYSGQWGDIVGVALHPDADLAARHACLEVDAEIALAFMEGRRTPQEWFVGPAMTNREAMQLVSRRHQRRLVDLSCLDETWVELGAERIAKPLRVVLSVAPSEGCIVFRLEDDAAFDEITSGEKEFVVMVTRQGDPSQVYERIAVNVAELIAKRHIAVLIAKDLPPISVFARRLVEATYVEFLDHIDEHLLRLPLPERHFLDMVHCHPVDAADDKPALTLTVSRQERTMHVNAPPRAQMYDRALREMPVLFVRPRDPSFILFGAQVNVEQLRGEEKLAIDAPEWLYAQEFDVLFPCVFQNNRIIEV